MEYHQNSNSSIFFIFPYFQFICCLLLPAKLISNLKKTSFFYVSNVFLREYVLGNKNLGQSLGKKSTKKRCRLRESDPIFTFFFDYL